MSPVSPMLVIGVGNDYRGDDGVGLMVLRVLKTKPLSHTVCIECNGDGVTLMEAWSNADRVILIDALSSGAPPGTIHRFEVHSQPMPAGHAFPSTHAFGVAEAICLSKAFYQLPAHMILYGIEGKNFAAGTQLLPEVENAIGEVVEAIVQEIHQAGNLLTCRPIAERSRTQICLKLKNRSNT